jgi:hypothetical protein
LKELVAGMTGDRQWRNPLPPNRPLTAAQRDDMLTRLHDMPGMRAILEPA